jgi:hypothetical protein
VEALNLTDAQQAFLAEHGIVFDFAQMSEDDFAKLEEDLGDLLVAEGLDESYDDNAIGKQVRAIQDLLED